MWRGVVCVAMRCDVVWCGVQTNNSKADKAARKAAAIEKAAKKDAEAKAKPAEKEVKEKEKEKDEEELDPKAYFENRVKQFAVF